MGELIRRPDNLPEEKADTKSLPSNVRKKITTAITEFSENQKAETLALVLRRSEVGRDIYKTIHKTSVYIAKIPANLQEKWESGELQFMEKKDTGEKLGVVVGNNNFGNNGFVRIEEAQFSNANLPRSLADLAMQQQLAHIAKVVDEIRSRVVLLQETYDHELLGELRGMHEQLFQIGKTQDPETRKQLATNAITALNITRGKIVQRLIDEIGNMPDIPKYKFFVAVKTFFSNGFYPKVEQGYDKAQELFEYYLSATQLLAYAYAFLNEKNAFLDIFTPDPDLTSPELLEKMEKAESLCESEVSSCWYKDPELFLGKLSEETLAIFQSEKEFIEIEVKGQKLLEAMNNESEERGNQHEKEDLQGD